MKNISHIRLILTCATCLIVLNCVSGCSEQGESEAANPKPVPKLDHHKPASYFAAVRRLVEIHEQLVSNDEVPEPISYKVREVNHAHGDGAAHVHYHLVDDSAVQCDHDHEQGDDHSHDDHDHSHDDPFAPEHTITVDVFTELTDVVRWLPEIAADGDMPSEDWDKVNKISESLTGQLESEIAGKPAATQHESYKAQSKTIATSLAELEAMVDSENVPATGLLN